MRTVVVQGRGNLPAAELQALGEPVASVGVLSWFDPAPMFSAIVKVTFSYAQGSFVLADTPRSLSLGESYGVSGSDHEPYYPSDFVPHKSQADVLLAGHAYGVGSAPQAQIVAALTFGELNRRFVVQTDQPGYRIPLLARHIRSLTGESAATVGPVVVERSPLSEPHHDPDFDYGAYNAAAPAQRGPFADGPRRVRLEGLSARGLVELELPDLHPRVLVSPRGPVPDFELELHADTVWFDTDAEQCVILWRGSELLAQPRGLDKLAVSLECRSEARPWVEILRSAPQGRFEFALTADDLDATAHDEEEKQALTMARYEAMCHERAAEPLLPLEQYVAIAAELAEQREERAVVLERDGFSEDTWTVEERAWLERMAEQAMEGDGRLVAQYGTLFVAAQDGLASPDEAKISLAQYANAAVALGESEDLAAELDRLGLTLASWMRLDRRFKKATAQDDALAAELEELMQQERAKAEAEP